MPAQAQVGRPIIDRDAFAGVDHNPFCPFGQWTFRDGFCGDWDYWFFLSRYNGLCAQVFVGGDHHDLHNFDLQHGGPSTADQQIVGGSYEQIPDSDIICITGIEDLAISDTLCDPNAVEALPPLTVDEPTVSMTFQVNDSPFAGKEGKFVTSRNIKERLEKELLHNVALRVEEGDSADKFKVSGRGELHLSVLIETMRREGFELGISRPEVVIKEVDGEKQEPYENVTIDIEEQHQGPIMEQMGLRKGDLTNMIPDGKGRMRHLVELVHAEERRTRVGPSGLATWLRAARAAAGDGEDRDGKVLKHTGTLQGHTDAVWAVAVAPNGTVYSGIPDGYCSGEVRNRHGRTHRWPGRPCRSGRRACGSIPNV